MDDMDFEKYIKLNNNNPMPYSEWYNTIQLALLLAKKLQEGVISQNILTKVGTMNNYDFETGQDYACADQDHIKWFNDVTRALIEETLGEMGYE
jgi:hypothetical protein